VTKLIHLCAILTVGLLILAACEDSSAPDSFNDTPSVSSLKILPASMTIGPTNTFGVFEAQGGVGPFSWSIGDTSLGTIPVSTAHLITYTRVASAFGAHAISLKDANGWIATAEIWQPDTTNEVASP
jgi:hypothetical protein